MPEISELMQSPGLSEELRPVCEECWASFASLHSLTGHIRLAHSIRMVGVAHAIQRDRATCDGCGFDILRSRRHQTLPSHMSKIHGFDGLENEPPLKPRRPKRIREYFCDECPYSFRCQESLYRHSLSFHGGIKTASQEALRTCDLCGESNRHMSSHWVQKHFALPVKEYAAFLRRSKQKSRLACEECNRSFINPVTLTMHLRRNHSNRMKWDAPRKPASREKKICDECGVIIARDPTGNHIAEHLGKLHQFEALVTSTPAKTIIKKKGNFRCDECKFSASRAPSLFRHTFSSHAGRPMPKYNRTCDLCEFTGQEIYEHWCREHQCLPRKRRVRPGRILQRLFCDECGYYGLKFLLRRHLAKSHFADPKYRAFDKEQPRQLCDECDSKVPFKREAFLKHLRSQHGFHHFSAELERQRFHENAQSQASAKKHRRVCDECGALRPRGYGELAMLSHLLERHGFRSLAAAVAQGRARSAADKRDWKNRKRLKGKDLGDGNEARCLK